MTTTPTKRINDIIRLNSLGLSLGTIAKTVSCHPTTVKQSLDKLNIPPADTRRAFMEDIYNSLSKEQIAWLSEQLGPRLSIKDFMLNLLVEKFVAAS